MTVIVSTLTVQVVSFPVPTAVLPNAALSVVVPGLPWPFVWPHSTPSRRCNVSTDSDMLRSLNSFLFSVLIIPLSLNFNLFVKCNLSRILIVHKAFLSFRNLQNSLLFYLIVSREIHDFAYLLSFPEDLI